MTRTKRLVATVRNRQDGQASFIDSTDYSSKAEMAKEIRACGMSIINNYIWIGSEFDRFMAGDPEMEGKLERHIQNQQMHSKVYREVQKIRKK